MKATEPGLPNFFGSLPGVQFVPRTHARVVLEEAGQEDNVRPIAVRDSAAFQCAQIILVRANPDGSDGGQYGSPIPLPERVGPPTLPYTQFQNPAGGGAQITMPSPAQHLYVRVALFANKDPVTGACSGASDVYPQDDTGATVGGVNFINVYSNGSSPDPLVRSVTLGPACAPDQYFSYNSTCSVTVSAAVDFAGGGSGIVRINGNAQSGGSGTYTASFGVSAQSGPNQYKIDVEQQTGSTSKGTCTDKNNNRCKFSFGVEQQAYSATDDDGEPSNSGPISLVQIGEGAPGLGQNSFAKNATHSLVFTVRLIGLANSLPTDPAFFRFPVQGSKRTGVVDCGQGNGAQEAYDTVLNGCPLGTFIWPAGSACFSPTNPRPSDGAIDCVGIVPGNRRQKIAKAFQDRIGTACNYWNEYRESGGTVWNSPPEDPRRVTFIITSPIDLSGNGGSANDIPIILFATLYVTGADGLTGNSTGCQNEKFPGKSDKFAVWGHWIKYASSGIGSGKACKPNEFGDCVAQLDE